MRIELDVFSGRPNPSWQMTAEESAEFRHRTSSLPKTEKLSDEGGLGYRGFVISDSGKAVGTPSNIRVYKGVLTINGDGTEDHYNDVNGVEQLLLRQAHNHGYGELVSGIIEIEKQ
jgi:hypothetical protein